MKEKFIIGNWYKNPRWMEKTDFARCSAENLDKHGNLIFSESIRWGKYSKGSGRWVGVGAIPVDQKEELEYIRKFLIDNYSVESLESLKLDLDNMDKNNSYYEIY